ncbi:MAG TPA: C40 family peptidase [Dokdonella sp.]|uniref:C40 family peptidase n=1 Tax=Dokdonella sp. TaxID=2291710 RepID=UPI002BE0BBFE|nr:C40 family peptidase [Dokdonella sp.]HUD43316.1 C40 family peptidase [Dokdonella sp.]
MRKHPARLRRVHGLSLGLALLLAADLHAASLDWTGPIGLDAWLGTPTTTSLALPAAESASAAMPAENQTAAARPDPGHLLIALAKDLRNIRYRRGGTNPKTGFDCSGFVRYVFQHALGIELPIGSAAQFRIGDTIDRSQMQAGDLVFFRTAGRRISHVGIYVAEGRFIHAPSAGKVVRVDSLEERYWARRFAGAKRPEAIART